jgi:uncharacterized membrane protein
VFLARRALSSVADAAALAAAQAVDRADVYAGAGGGCGDLLPVDPDGARQQVDNAVADDLTDLHQTFAAVEPPDVNVERGTVSVRLSGDVGVPFGKVLALLDPGRPDGRVHVTVTSSAQSPVTAPNGC